ncbi:hypothetical protein UFOVP276_24 [uncultured Caudovirales phage]|uniref:Uncharacterized protein n=1 Tax=uncultured Caudovirales phage TaxID=2100421 RepID=A0A6J5LJZ1_9CAUD|nr:hypothetical protein UFOVP127_161 [uncultured Caudovirales phage]CAB4134874.1 hypothetical protein UFOVP276_24 [uncultured Caudovirales phage]
MKLNKKQTNAVNKINEQLRALRKKLAEEVAKEKEAIAELRKLRKTAYPQMDEIEKQCELATKKLDEEACAQITKLKKPIEAVEKKEEKAHSNVYQLRLKVEDLLTDRDACYSIRYCSHCGQSK